jgi:phage-related protein
VAGFLALGPAITVVSALLPALLAGFGALVPVLGVVLSSFGLIANIVGVLGGPLTILAVAVAALAVAWSQNWGGIRDQTAGVVAVVQGFITSTLLPALQGIATFVAGTLVPGWAAGWAAIVTAFAPVTATILPALQTMWAGIVSGVQQALPGLTMLAGGFLMLVEAATPLVRAIMAEVMPTLAELGANFIQFATVVIPQFAAAFAAMAAAPWATSRRVSVSPSR